MSADDALVLLAGVNAALCAINVGRFVHNGSAVTLAIGVFGGLVAIITGVPR